MVGLVDGLDVIFEGIQLVEPLPRSFEISGGGNFPTHKEKLDPIMIINLFSLTEHISVVIFITKNRMD